jgi:hypothetical protein
VAANGCQFNDSNCGYGSLSVLLGNGDGTFQAGSLLTVPDGNFLSLLLADISGDGIPDAIAANLTGVAVFAGNQNGSFQAPVVYAGLSTYGQNLRLGLADLNIIQPGLNAGVVAVLVNKAGTYLVSTSSPNPSSGSQAVTLTTTVSASYLTTGLTPTGSITYYDGTTSLGSAPLVGGVASFNITTGLSKGVHTITPYYSGDSNFNAHSGTPIAQVVTGGIPAVTLSSGSLTFGNQPVTITSGAKSVTLTNSGTGPLTITSIAPSGDFSQTNDCPLSPNTLIAGAHCTISVSFTPTATGSRMGAVTVTDNASGSPQSIALSGTGTNFSVAATPSGQTLKGKSAKYMLSVTPISGFTGTVALSCTAPPSGSCTMLPTSVALNGTSAPTATATVTATNGKKGTPSGTYTLTLTGTFSTLSHNTTVTITIP